MRQNVKFLNIYKCTFQTQHRNLIIVYRQVLALVNWCFVVFFFPKGYIPVNNFKDSFLSKQGRTCFPFIYH